MKSPYCLIDPKSKHCPFFNPMTRPEAFRNFLSYGEPTQDIALKYAFHILSELDQNEGVTGHWATPINLSRLLHNSGGAGRKMVMQFSQITSKTSEEAKKNADIASWFMNDYLTEGSDRYKAMTPCIDRLDALNAGVWKDVINPDFDKGEKSQLDECDKDTLYMSVSWMTAEKDLIDTEFTDFVINYL